MAKSNLAFAALDSVEPITGAPAVTTLDGLPKTKKIALSQVKAHFSDNFKRASLTEQRKALKSKDDASMMLVDTYVGYALHKAHSGMGANEPGMSDAQAQIVYSKDGKKITSATEHFKAAFDILDNVANKELAESTIADFEIFKSDIEMSFMLALIAGPQEKRDNQKIKREVEKALNSPSTEGAEGAEGEELPPELVDAAVNNIIATFDALTMAQLEKLQAAITAAINKLPPM